MVQLIQLSDTHLMAQEDGILYDREPCATLEQIMERVRERFPRVRMAVLTGDLTQDGEPEAYRLLERTLAPFRCPVYALPGNHDDPDMMAKELTGSPVRVARSVIMSGWNIIFLNSAVPGEPGGHLTEDELNRLDELLKERGDMPALIALHHHPVPIDSAWMDAIALDNPEDFFTVIDRHLHVKGVIFGHVHQSVDQDRGPVRFLGAPSTLSQFQPRTDEPVPSDVAPGYRWLTLHPDGRIETGVEYLDGEEEQSNQREMKDKVPQQEPTGDATSDESSKENDSVQNSTRGESA
ncbi:MAG: phosphodiesterase [Magnetococcales bacterium]|nr:phosphodiesterase [Magnetococcales bacterium]